MCRCLTSLFLRVTLQYGSLLKHWPFLRRAVPAELACGSWGAAAPSFALHVQSGGSETQANVATSSASIFTASGPSLSVCPSESSGCPSAGMLLRRRGVLGAGAPERKRRGLEGSLQTSSYMAENTCLLLPLAMRYYTF